MKEENLRRKDPRKDGADLPSDATLTGDDAPATDASEDWASAAGADPAFFLKSSEPE